MFLLSADPEPPIAEYSRVSPIENTVEYSAVHLRRAGAGLQQSTARALQTVSPATCQRRRARAPRLGNADRMAVPGSRGRGGRFYLLILNPLWGGGSLSPERCIIYNYYL